MTILVFVLLDENRLHVYIKIGTLLALFIPQVGRYLVYVR